MLTNGKGMSRASQKRKRKQEKQAPNLKNSENSQHSIENSNKNVSVTVGDEGMGTALNIEFDILHLERFQDIFTYLDSTETMDYNSLSSSLLYFLIYPENPREFYKLFWGSKLFHSNRKKHNYFKGILSRNSMESVFKTHALYYSKDIVLSSSSDVESLLSGCKTEENIIEDKAAIRCNTLWQNFESGDSICWLTSVQYNDKIWKLLSLLEIEFESIVNCQVFLISPNGKKSFVYLIP